MPLDTSMKAATNSSEYGIDKYGFNHLPPADYEINVNDQTDIDIMMEDEFSQLDRDAKFH